MLKILQELRRPLSPRFDRLRSAGDAAVFGLILASTLVIVEALGPGFRSEFGDVALAMVASLGLLLAGLWVQTRQPGWTASARQAFLQFWAKRRFSTGIDFRPLHGSSLPDYRGPFVLIGVLTAVTLTSTLLLQGLGHLPHALYRSAPYSLYLALTSGLWLSGIVIIFAGSLIVYLQFRRLLKKIDFATRPTRVWAAAPMSLGILLGVVLLDSWIDPLFAILVHGSCVVAPLLLLLRPSPDDYRYTVKRARDGHLSQMSHGTLMITFCLSVAMVATLAFVLFQGYRLPGGSPPLFPMPFTGFIGRGVNAILLCLAPYLIGSLLFTNLIRRFREDPSLTNPAKIRLMPDVAPPTAEQKESLRQAGLQVQAFSENELGCDLVLYGEKRPAENFAPAYPLENGWEDGKLIETLQRRVRRSLRRRFLEKTQALLETIDAENKTSAKESGEGFYYAPQWWVLNGINRDGEDSDDEDAFDLEGDDQECLGMTYHKAYGLQLRSYIREVLQRCDLDIIFVQDGVRHSQFLKVLERLTHLAQREDSEPTLERDFQGLIGLSVHIQSIDFEERTHSSNQGFPEPNYDDISRARILLIFRDEEGDQTQDPDDPSHEYEGDDDWLREVLDQLSPSTLTL